MPEQNIAPTFQTPEADPQAAAVGLALAVLRRTGAPTMAELIAEATADPAGETATKLAKITFAVDQLELLEAQSGAVATIDMSAGVVPAPCTECGVPVLVAKGAPGASCTLTRGCTGKPARPAAARLTPKPKRETAAA